MTTFRFPIPRSEQVLLLCGASIAVGVTLALVVLMRDLAGSAGLGLMEFLDMTPSVRAPFAVLCIVNVLALYGLVSFVRSKNSASLTLTGSTIRFARLGALGLPIGGADVTLSADAVDVVRVQRVRRGTVLRVEAEVLAGREGIRVNLEHADPGTPVDVADSNTWLAHPLVNALEAAVGKEATVL